MRYLIKLSSLLLISSFIIACGNNKKDNGDSDRDTGVANSVTRPDSDLTSPTTQAGTESNARSADSGTNDKDAILANIDQYLVSKTSIADATLTVQNTIKDATINKAYAEVKVMDANNKVLRSDFLILENIQAGDSKSVRIPNVSGAASISSRIVRLKSDQLTNGETINVGSLYVPK